MSTHSYRGERRHRRGPTRQQARRDLESLVREAGGPGHALEEPEQRKFPSGSSRKRTVDGVCPSPWSNHDEIAAGLHGQRISGTTSVSLHRGRLFRTPGASTTNRGGQAQPLKSTGMKFPSSRLSKQSRFSRASSSRQGSSSGGVPAVHVVCAISENLARETCVSSLDAGSPLYLYATKQANGQTYLETISYLEVLKPDEVLLNEGRRSSQLARKILEFYNQQEGSTLYPTTDSTNDSKNEEYDHGGHERSINGPCATSTVVKFISRAYFDQTKGAELLRRLAREETYNTSVMEEYILLSSANAVLNYTQLTLGVSVAPGCLFLNVNAGGRNRMEIDRSTLLHLELLVNSKTGKAKNSLIGTVDKTKTTVGSRLLRSNLMSPPTEIETITARLDLVDRFLTDDSFFFHVYEHLIHLPDMDKILSNIALIPRIPAPGEGKKLSQASQERTASKGISALVCIKSCLSAMPAFAQVLTTHLNSHDQHDKQEARGHAHVSSDHESVQTHRNSLMIGIGSLSNAQSKSIQLAPNHLIRAIVFAMSNPSLEELLTVVSDAFTPSTEFSRNSNAMRHQECFALKAEEEGIVSILRKAFLANVDDIYRKADDYAESFGMTVTVKHTAGRGYFLSIPLDHCTEFPKLFIQATKSGRFIHCSTEEVTSLNMRARENVHDLLVLTYDRIQEILEIARSHYDALAALSDAIALLDMCHGFADIVSLSDEPWCRPLLSAGRKQSRESCGEEDDMTNTADPSPCRQNTLVIRNGRFGIDVSSTRSADLGPFVPNDTFSGGEKYFTIITGINGKQIMYSLHITITTWGLLTCIILLLGLEKTQAAGKARI